MKFRTISAVLAITAALLITGCAKSSTNDIAESKAGSSVPSQTITPDTNVPTSVPNDPAVRKLVKITACTASDGGWSAKGTASNDSQKPKDFTITIFFTTPKATVLHTESTTVKVDAGKQADWAIDAKFTAPEGTHCVLRGVA